MTKELTKSNGYCQKCGGNQWGSDYQYCWEDDVLKVTCGQCGYFWYEALPWSYGGGTQSVAIAA